MKPTNSAFRMICCALLLWTPTLPAQTPATSPHQPKNANLTSIAGLSTTSYGLSVLTQADANALRTLAGLGSLATLSAVTSAQITDGTIVRADIASAAYSTGGNGNADLYKFAVYGSGGSLSVSNALSVVALSGNANVNYLPDGILYQNVSGTAHYVYLLLPTPTADCQLTLPDKTGTLAVTSDILSASALLNTIGSTRGSILYRGASGWAILGPGTSGYALTSNGAGADPTYQPSGGGIVIGTTTANGTAGRPLYTDGTNVQQYTTVPASVGGTGVANSGTLTFSGNPTLTGITTTGTGTVATTAAKTFTFSNTLTLAGTDGSTLNVGAGGTLGSAAFTATSAYVPAASVTGGGVLGTGGFTLTIPATGTAALLGTANVFTALQTITQGAANTGVLTSTGYSLTGTNATSMIDLAGTWNTSGIPKAFVLAITDTASANTSEYFSVYAGSAGTTPKLIVSKGSTGTYLRLGGAAISPILCDENNGFLTVRRTDAAGGNLVGFGGSSDNTGRVALGDGGCVAWGGSAYPASGGNNLFLGQKNGIAASLQVGLNAASSQVSQIFSACGPRIGTDTNTTPSNTLTLAGPHSTGTGTGGNLILGVYGTNGASGTAIGTLNPVITITASGKSIKAGSNGSTFTHIKRATVTLVAGTATVTDTDTTSTTVISMSIISSGGTVGLLSYTRSAGASYTINSASALDTSTVEIIAIHFN